jgi:tetratricopeptide (TPR) repeat protein
MVEEIDVVIVFEGTTGKKYATSLETALKDNGHSPLSVDVNRANLGKDEKKGIYEKIRNCDYFIMVVTSLVSKPEDRQELIQYIYQRHRPRTALWKYDNDNKRRQKRRTILCFWVGADISEIESILPSYSALMEFEDENGLVKLVTGAINKIKTKEKKNLKIKIMALCDALKSNPHSDAYVELNLDESLSQLLELDEAEIEFRKLIREYRGDFKIYEIFTSCLKKSRCAWAWECVEILSREMVKANPKDVQLHCDLGNILRVLERYEEAEKEYKEAIRINSKDSTVHYVFADLLQSLKRYDEAVKEYREIIKITPNDAYAHFDLGRLLQNLKRYKYAEKEYKEAIRLDPDHSTAHKNLGKVLINSKKYKEAEKEYKEAIRTNLDDAESHYDLGLLYMQIGNNDDSSEEILKAKVLFERQGREDEVKFCDMYLAKLVDMNIENAKNCNKKGLSYYKSGNFEKAEREFRESIREDPNFVEAHYNLGVLLKDLKRYDEAVKNYREVIRIKPDYAETYHIHSILGRLLKDLKRYEEAAREYKEELTINSKDIEAIKDLSKILKYLKHREEVKKAMNRKSNFAEEHNKLGSLLKNLNRYEDAEKEFREAIKIEPNNVEAHMNLARQLVDLERYEDAEKTYKKILRINPNDKKTCELGNIYYESAKKLQNLNRYKESVKEYRKAAMAIPNDSYVHFRFGNLLIVLKQFDEAKREISKARDLFEKEKNRTRLKECETILDSIKKQSRGK